MKRISAVIIIGLLCFSMFPMVAPSLVKVSAISPPGKVEGVTTYPSGSILLLLWGNPLINGFPDPTVTGFKIYKDGSLLTTVDWHTCRYRDTNPVNRWCQYGVSAVNAGGEGPQYTTMDWWSPGGPAIYYDLTVYCNPPEGGKIGGMFNLRSGQIWAYNAPTQRIAWEAPGYNITSGWTKTGSISITFYPNDRACYIDSWWGNDATITAYFQKLPTHDVTISAHCTTEGMDVSVPITMDGVSTGYYTPYNFSGLTSSHTFAVPGTDPNGHPFIQWSTGETTTTITVSANGTYVAYYQSQTYDAWIAAHCYCEGVDISLPIIMDGEYTGFSTSHQFTGLKGNHTFTMPRVDSLGHPFSQWNTGQTTPTITVSAGATYTAYYDLSYIVLLDAKCSQSSVGFGKNVEVQVTGKNTGTSAASRVVEIKANGQHVAYASLSLQPGQTGSVPVIVSTKGLPAGTYPITLTDDQLHISPTINVPDKPYFIIVAGRDLGEGSNKDKEYWGILDDCDLAYRTLTTKLHVSTSQICYLAPEPRYDQNGNLETYPNQDCSSDSISWAIEYWANRADIGQLFLYLRGHGDVDSFVANRYLDSNGFHHNDVLAANSLVLYLNVLKNLKHPEINVIMDACHCGSFINDLSSVASATVCSCRSWQLSIGLGYPICPSFFSQTFWNAIAEGDSVFGAYFLALIVVGGPSLGLQEPVFDDTRSGIEYCPIDTAPPPNEGNYLSTLYMGNCEWTYPYVSSAISTQYYSWPPPATVPLWATIENDSALANVTVSMLPPDYVPENDTLNLETFRMVDAKGDGNFSVQIPSTNFTKHASGPSVFEFILAATQVDGTSGYIRTVVVNFTQNGQPAADNTPPTTFITRPLNLDTVTGIVNINGTACDDVCLQKTELYVDNALSKSLTLPASSTSFFQFSLDTSTLTNGYHNVTTMAYDTSGNRSNDTVSIWVENDVRDIGIANLDEQKTVSCQSFLVPCNVTVINKGSSSESFNLTLFANSTVIQTTTITNLSSNEVATTQFAWNATGFAYGNYTLTAYASLLSNESDTENNMFVGNLVTITIIGDVNGDGKVNLADVFAVALAYGSFPGHPMWNPNYDINNDGKINLIDYFITALNYGKTI